MRREDESESRMRTLRGAREAHQPTLSTEQTRTESPAIPGDNILELLPRSGALHATAAFAGWGS